MLIDKLNFNSNDITTVTKAKTINLGGLRGRVASCYMTKQEFLELEPGDIVIQQGKACKEVNGVLFEVLEKDI